jgi:hypothetical protein
VIATCDRFRRPKRCYTTEIEAKIAIDVMRSRGTGKVGVPFARERLQSLAPFQCEVCGSWHVGSQRGLAPKLLASSQKQAALDALASAPEEMHTSAAAAFCFVGVRRVLNAVGQHLWPKLVDNGGPDYLFSRDQLRAWVVAGWPRSSPRVRMRVVLDRHFPPKEKLA